MSNVYGVDDKNTCETMKTSENIKKIQNIFKKNGI